MQPVTMILIHVPHASTHIPPDLRDDFLLTDDELAQELLLMTDRYTDEMARAMAASRLPGGGVPQADSVEVVEAPVSRLVCDVERFRDDRAEPMSAVGMGAIYTQTSSGAPLRPTGAAAGAAREGVLARYYDPHHARLDDLTADALEREGRCLLIDLHSFPSRALPYEQDHSLARPEICIGTDSFHTTEDLAAAAERFFTEAGLETIRNQPFSGALVPGRFYHGDRRVISVMIEVRRDLYMDERTGDRNAGFRRIEALMAEFVAEVARSQSSV
ncbi:MAG: N-formylglutamate amidohydrolase [Spirochaetia bacterium]